MNFTPNVKLIKIFPKRNIFTLLISSWFLTLSLICNASTYNENKMSISIGPTAISSQIGYFLELTTPYSSSGLSSSHAMSFQFAQLSFSGIANNDFSNRFQEKSYYNFQFTSLNKVWSITNLDVYFKSGGFFIPTGALSDQSNIGLQFSIGADFFSDKSIVSMTSELGYSFPLLGGASKFRNESYSRGISMLIGAKFHLF